jgi:hypothetical protein
MCYIGISSNRTGQTLRVEAADVAHVPPGSNCILELLEPLKQSITKCLHALHVLLLCSMEILSR